MSDIREIRSHMESVRDTEKVTKAMHMIAATKMRKAKAELESSRPYFAAVTTEVKRIFRVSSNVESPYYYPLNGDRVLPGEYGFLVITADKGLAGNYNTAVLKEVEKQVKDHDARLYVMGEYGRRYFTSRQVPFVEDFHFTAANPSLQRARVIAARLLRDFRNKEVSKLFVIYTDLKSSVSQQANCFRILPFHRGDVAVDTQEKAVTKPFVFYPSLEVVLDNMVDSYVAGYIYSAIVDSFCCEQTARMNAMEEANNNAEEILFELKQEYNHARQGKITKEITEISSGAKALARKKNERERNTGK